MSLPTLGGRAEAAVPRGVAEAVAVAFPAAGAALAAVEREENGNMKKSTFTKQLDHPAIEAAIARAEAATSGEIRVVVFHQPAPEPVAAAQSAFTRLKMEQTRERNGVLIFVAPVSQTFAVIGDEGVHLKCGQAFWDELATAMAGSFRQGDFTAGLVAGIERAGNLLAAHFPRRPDDTNELPDGVVEQ